MRFELRLFGTTGDGVACQADIVVYATGVKDMQQQADAAARTAAWMASARPGAPIPEGSHITIERVEKL